MPRPKSDKFFKRRGADKPARSSTPAATDRVTSGSPELEEHNNDQRKSLGQMYTEDKGTREESPVTRRMTKARKEADEAAKAERMTQVTSITNVIAFALNIVCTRMPKGKPLTDFEREGFQEACKPVIEKYFEALKFKEELALFLMLVVIIEPRVGKEKKKEGATEVVAPAVAA